MMTAEIRINGSLIAHIYARNLCKPGKLDTYYWEYYSPEHRGTRAGEVKHRREDGAAALVALIVREASEGK